MDKAREAWINERRKAFRQEMNQTNAFLFLSLKGRQMGWTNWMKNQIDKYNSMTPQERFNEEFMTQFPKEQN